MRNGLAGGQAPDRPVLIGDAAAEPAPVLAREPAVHAGHAAPADAHRAIGSHGDCHPPIAPDALRLCRSWSVVAACR